MKRYTKCAIFCGFLGSCATPDMKQASLSENQPCKLREIERFIRHFACPSGTYIQRIQTVAASTRSDPVLQVTCVRVVVECEGLKREPQPPSGSAPPVPLDL